MKNVSNQKNPPDELSYNDSKKKNGGRIIIYFENDSNSIFRPAGINSELS